MGLLDTMREADAQQQTSETLQALMSQLDAQASQLTKLTKAVNDLSGYVKVMDEQQEIRLTRLSTSQPPELPSTSQLDDETRNRLSEIEKTLAAVASQLSSSEAVKLPDGSSVRRSDLDTHLMMTRIEKQLARTARSSDELAETVKKRGNVRIDTAKLEQHAVKVLDARLAKAVEPSVARVEQTLAGFETQVAEVGAQRVTEAAQEVEQVTDRADAVVASVRFVEARLEALEGKVTWTAVGRLCLALLPVSVVLLVIGGLVGGIAYAAGFGPLLGWAWGAFTAAQAWWAKTLIAVGTLGGVAGFGALVWWLAKRLGEDFRHW